MKHTPKFQLLFCIIALLFCSILEPACAKYVEKTGNWNFNETTGIVNMPSARVLPYRSARFSIGMAKLGLNPPLKHKWQVANPGPLTGTPLDSDWWIDNDGDRSLLVSPIRNVEIGLMNVHSQALTPSISAKWLAIPETDKFPAIAIGIHNAFSLKEDDGSREYSAHPLEIQNANSKAAPFIVASKYFGKNDMLDLTLGYGGGRFRNRIIYGGELFFDAKHLFSAVGEYNGATHAYGFKYRTPNQRWDFSLVMQSDQPGFRVGYTMPW